MQHLPQEQLKRFGFSESELERAKQNYLSAMEAAFKEINKTNSTSYVGEYQRLFLNEEASPGMAWEYQFVKAHLSAITLDQVNTLVKEHVNEKNRDIILLAPEINHANLPDSIVVAGWMRAVSEKEMVAYTDEISQQTLLLNEPIPV